MGNLNLDLKPKGPGLNMTWSKHSDMNVLVDQLT